MNGWNKMDEIDMDSQEKCYEVKKFPMPTKRYCQTLNLKNNPALIAEYRRLHSRREVWPEILAGIRSVGILEMEMYIRGVTVCMIMETPVDFDWDTAMERLSRLPRQQEWEDCVAHFQECVPGSGSAQKWKLMERMFYLYE